jgi:hypothetical protein
VGAAALAVGPVPGQRAGAPDNDVRPSGGTAVREKQDMLYGRYGYGMATRHASFTIRRGEGALAADAPSDSAIRLRIASPKECRRELEEVYGTVLRSRPGFVARSAAWWDRAMRDPGGQTPLNCLLAGDAAGPRGYALYAADNRWEDEDSLHDCTLTITEPEVSVGVRELGAAYLGGIRLGSLADAGLVAEHRPGALTRLSAAMSWDPSPWRTVAF